MLNRRGRDQRVLVDLPVNFTYEDEANNHKVTLQGKIEDLSINGMKIALPLSSEILANDSIDFALDLPSPFLNIKGQGKIQWKRWDSNKNCTSCGLKLEPMTLKQLTELDALITEVIDE